MAGRAPALAGGTVLYRLCCLTAYTQTMSMFQSEDRLASFDAWLAACEPAVAVPPGMFARILRENRAGYGIAKAASSPEVAALLALLKETPTHTWSGTPDDLAKVLVGIGTRTGQPLTTLAPNAITRHLRAEKDVLAGLYGLTWTEGFHNKHRWLTFNLAAAA
jgi:hypothetical protein